MPGIEFLCGVAATLAVETVALIAATVWISAKSKKLKGTEAQHGKK